MMAASQFEVISKYWAGPISNVVIIIAVVLILYPVIWKISVHQLTAAINALNAAKELPGTIAQLNDASDKLRDVNREIMELAPKLASIEAINDQLEIANRRLVDLQKSNEERPPEIIIDVNNSSPVKVREDEEEWNIVSTLWIEIRDSIESAVNGIVDGRIRRKYNTVPRHTYSVVVELLVNDGLISRAEADAVNNMDRNFRSLRNRRTLVTARTVGEFRQWYNVAEGIRTRTIQVQA